MLRSMRFAAFVVLSGCPVTCGDDDGTSALRRAGYPGPAGVGKCVLETTEVDSLNDGTIDLVIDNTYDANGFLVRTVEDVPPYADGIVQKDTVYTNDDQGRIVEERSTFYAQGMSFVGKTTNSYDADGNLGLIEFDGNNDGVVDMTIMNTYDEGDRLVVEERFGGGDILIQRNVFTYNDKGDLVQVDRDVNGDGVIDETTVHTLDVIGNPTLTEISPVGGPVVTRISYEYASFDQLTAKITVDVASGFAVREAFVYDSRRNLVGSTYDAGNDGTIESSSTSVWTCP